MNDINYQIARLLNHVGNIGLILIYIFHTESTFALAQLKCL